MTFPKFLLFFILFCCYLQLQSQTNIENLLLGKWLLIEESSNLEDHDGLLITGDPEENNLKEIRLHFQNNNNLSYYQLGESNQTTYAVEDSLLILGTRRFFIRELHSTVLHIEEDSEFFPTTYFYKKQED